MKPYCRNCCDYISHNPIDDDWAICQKCGKVNWIPVHFRSHPPEPIELPKDIIYDLAERIRAGEMRDCSGVLVPRLKRRV